MKKHVETHHKKNLVKEHSEEKKKRQLKTFTCPACNSTFVSNYRMRNHIKEQHEGKNILSPERKVARIESNQVKEEEKTVDGDTVRIQREEMENLQDLLLKTGKDKEELFKKVTECNRRMQNYENVNSKLEQENQYFKAENRKANEHIEKLHIEHQKEVQNVKK